MKEFELIEKNGNLFARPNPEYDEFIAAKKFDLFLKNSGIPVDYWDLTFEDIVSNFKKSKTSLDKCFIYAKNCLEEKYHNVSLYLEGTNSSGKSTVACAIGQVCISKGLKVKFIHAGILINLLLKNSGFGNDREVNGKLKDFDTCDLIIIDDVFDDKKSLMWTKPESKNMIIQEWDTFLRMHLADDIRFILTSNMKMSSVHTNYSKSIYELLDRNFLQLEFEDDIKMIRKHRFEGIFD